MIGSSVPGTAGTDEGRFMIFKDYDEMLKLEYGNYMQLPPEDEQVCKHNPVQIML